MLTFNSYILRVMVGVIAIALPIYVAFGPDDFLRGMTGTSVSAYYYSDGRDLFVGSLFIIGSFFAAYGGRTYSELLVAKLAAVSVILTALCPTAPLEATNYEKFIGGVHLSAAAILFVILAIFCLWFFPNIWRKGKSGRSPFELRRDRIYFFSGIFIILCIGLILLVNVGPVSDEIIQKWKPVYWLESTALFLFGISWIVAGRPRFLWFLVEPHEAWGRNRNMTGIAPFKY